MSGVGDTAVIQPNGQVGVPVIAAAAAAATSSILASPSEATTSTNPADVAASIQAENQATTAVDPTIQAQVMAPAISTLAEETIVAPAASDTHIVAMPTYILPVENVLISTPPSTSPAVVETTSSPLSDPSASLPVSQAPPPTAESSARPPPAGEAPPAAITEPTAEAILPSTSVSSIVPPAITSEPLPADQALIKPSQTGSAASALGDANVFAPAVSDEPVAATSDSSSPIPPSSSSQSAPPPDDSEIANDTSAISSQVSTTPVSSSATKATTSSHLTHASSASKTLDQDETATSSSEAAQTSLPKSEDRTTDSAESTLTQEANPDTTFVSGTVTYTGAAAVSAAEFAKTGDHKTAKNGMSSFAIIGIVGGILVFFILLYIAWFQWRRRRSSDDDSEDGDYMVNDNEFDPYGLAKEKHSGFDFIDQPLSSRRSDRYKSTATGVTANPFVDPQEKRGRNRDQDEEYVETWYSDPGEAGLGTAKSQQMWYDDRRPSYIDGPQSIYHETNDPSDPFNQRSEDDRPRSVPAAPPVPPLPVAYRKSSALSRPRTDFSYGDFYGGYDSARSRPGTQYTQYTHDQTPQTPSEGMTTPNTAAMLPWLHPTESPPLPSPPDQRSLSTRQVTNGFGSQPKKSLRGPVAAAMAQTPQMQDRGFQGVIPTFR